MKYNKGFIHILFLLIILAVGIFIALVYVLENSPRNTQSNGSSSQVVIPDMDTTGKDTSSPVFNFTFKYGVGAKNILDTFTKTYTKDMVAEKPIKTNLELSNEELQSIYQEIIELDLFNKKPMILTTNSVTTPCSSYDLKVQIDSKEKEINWNNCRSQIRDEFKQFTTYVTSIIESKSEYQKLPKTKALYQ